MSDRPSVASPAERLPWSWHAALQLLVLLTVGGFSALAVHHGCVNPGIQFNGVEPGTSRAGYCAATDGQAPWLPSMAMPVATLVVWFAMPFGRRRPMSGWLLVLAWIAVIIANATIANSLQFSYTIT